MNKKNGQQILEVFDLYSGDLTEFSTEEKLIIANTKLREIYTDGVWEFLRKIATGTVSGNEIDLSVSHPDFSLFMASYTDDPTYRNPDRRVLFLNNTQEIEIVPMASRKSQPSGSIFAYEDIVNAKLVFSTPVSGTYEFDYSYVPNDITESTTSALPAGYESVLIYKMLTDSDVIERMEKARTNYKENMLLAQLEMSKLKSWNANKILY